MTAAVLTAADGDLPDIPGQPYVSPDDLASIGPLWQQAVQQQLVPVVAEVYQTSAGVVHAQMVDATQVPTLPSVGSLAAEQYLAAATNTFTEVGDDLWATARSELLDGFEKGESIDQLAARLRASAGLTAKKAVLVARTQVLDASNAGSIATARASGIDMQKEWMSAEDSRVRPEHVLANGQKVDLNGKFTVGGYECDRPHDPTLPPALRYSCRCTTGYLIPDDSVDDAVRDAEPVPPIPGTSGIEPLPDPYAGDLVAPALPGPGVGVPGEAAPLPGLAVRPVLEAARTTSAVQSVFAAETRRITGRFIPIRFTGSAATAREHAEGLLRGLERFPDAKLGGIDAMEARGAAYAATSYNEILFSELWTSPAARRHYLGSVATDVQDGWHVANSGNPVAIALHEFGHLLDFTTDINRGVRVRIREVVARRAAAEQVAQDVLIRREVSGYATSHTDELVAEAFTDVMINGGAASPLSREIFDLLEDAYRQAGGTVRAVVQRDLAFSLPSPTAGLAARTVPQLRALAKERGITVPSGSKKADIVRLLDEGPGAPAAAPVAVEVPLAKRTVAQLRALAADRNITVPKGARKPDIVRLLEAPPLTEAEQRAAVRALARETNTLIEQTSATARVLAEVDELLAKKASAATIREAIADALAEPGQLFAGADPAVLAALRAVASDPVKLRAAVTRLGGKAKIKPVSKAGAKVTFDADTMEGVGGIDIEAGARVTVVRRGSTVTLPDGTVMQLDKARVTPVTTPVKAVPAKATPVKRLPTQAPSVDDYSGDYTARQARLRGDFDAAHGGEPTVTRFEGGIAADTELLTYPDGFQVVRKDYQRKGDKPDRIDRLKADAEELAAQVLDAFGLPTPAVTRANPHTVYMEFVDGVQGGESGVLRAPASVTSSEQGRRLGLADAVMGHRDRNGGGWMRVGDGIVPIDNGGAFGGVGGDTAAFGNPFTNYLMTRDRWKPDVDVDPVELAEIRTRLVALRPEFERLDMAQAHKYMLARLDEIAKRAVGKPAVKKAAPAKKAPAKKAPAAKVGPVSVRQPGVDLTPEVTPDAAWLQQAGLRRSFGDPTDKVLTSIVRQQPGWSDPGRVVSQAELDRAVRSGWVEMWRGVQDYPAGSTAADIARATRVGDWDMGTGMFGNGIYTTVRRTTAEVYRSSDFVDWKPTRMSSWGPEPLYEWLPGFTPTPQGAGGLLRMALDPNARIIDYEDLKWEHRTFLQSIDFTGLQDTAWQDQNFYAVMRGYDGVRVYGPGTNDGSAYPAGVRNSDEPPQFIIFNRSVLIFERASRRYDS